MKKKKTENASDSLRPPSEMLQKRASTGGEHLLAASKILKKMDSVDVNGVMRKKSLTSVKEETKEQETVLVNGKSHKTLEPTSNGEVKRKSVTSKKEAQEERPMPAAVPGIKTVTKTSKLLETGPNGEIRRKSAPAKDEKSNLEEVRKKSSASVKDTKTIEVLVTKPEKEKTTEGEVPKVLKKKKKITTVTAELEKPKIADTKPEDAIKKALETVEVSEKRKSASSKRASQTEPVVESKVVSNGDIEKKVAAVAVEKKTIDISKESVVVETKTPLRKVNRSISIINHLDFSGCSPETRQVSWWCPQCRSNPDNSCEFFGNVCEAHCCWDGSPQGRCCEVGEDSGQEKGD